MSRTPTRRRSESDLVKAREDIAHAFSLGDLWLQSLKGSSYVRTIPGFSCSWDPGYPSLIEQPRLASPDSLINIRSARDWPSGRRYSSMRHNPARLRSGYLEMQVRPSIYHRWRPFYWQHVLLDFRHFNPCHLAKKTSNSHNHNHLDWIVTGHCSLFPRKTPSLPASATPITHEAELRWFYRIKACTVGLFPRQEERFRSQTYD